MSEETKSQTPPDHLSVNPDSEHFKMEALERGVGIRFKGKQRTDIEEYSIIHIRRCRRSTTWISREPPLHQTNNSE